MVRSLHDVCDEFQRSHMRGRPQIPISGDQLVYLLELHFTTEEIAFLLGVSPRTIRRRIIQFGLEDEVNFTNIHYKKVLAISLYTAPNPSLPFSDIIMASLKHFISSPNLTGRRSFRSQVLAVANIAF